MNGKNKLLPAAIVGVLIAAAIIGGVTVLGQQGILPGLNSTSSFGQTGTLAAQITDPPNVPAGVTGVYITYTDIKVHMVGSDNNTWDTVANTGSLDLMSVVNISETVGSNSVPVGTYNLVRFDIASATVTYNGKNFTASVPSNQITIPINGGGINVAAGGNVGFLIDVYPTVVPYQNGTSFSFVLVPAARSIPIPSMNWHQSDDEKGTKTDLSSQSWYQDGKDQLQGNISIVSASLSNSSLSVTVKNTGSTNVSLTALSILSSVQYPVNGGIDSTSAESTTTASSYSQTETQSSDSSTATTAYSHTETSVPSHDLEAELQTIASFQILSNGTIVQQGHEIEDANYSSLVLEPGQSITLSFSGAIATLHLDAIGLLSGNVPPASSSLIIAGQTYVIAVLGQFDTRAYTNVTATS